MPHRLEGIPLRGANRRQQTRDDTQLCSRPLIEHKLTVVQAARASGKSATTAAQLVEWSRATFYRHQGGLSPNQLGARPPHRETFSFGAIDFAAFDTDSYSPSLSRAIRKAWSQTSGGHFLGTIASSHQKENGIKQTVH